MQSISKVVVASSRRHPQQTRPLSLLCAGGTGLIVLLAPCSEVLAWSVSFKPHVDYATGSLPFSIPYSVAVADLNRDGKPDLVTANYGATVSVLLGKGDGTFATKTDYATGHYPGSVAAADLNRDGKPDLVTANSTADNFVGFVSVLLNSGP